LKKAARKIIEYEKRIKGYLNNKKINETDIMIIESFDE